MEATYIELQSRLDASIKVTNKKLDDLDELVSRLNKKMRNMEKLAKNLETT